MLIHFKLFYYCLRFITKWCYAYPCINMCIGFVFHIAKPPVGDLPSRTRLSASTKTGSMNKLQAQKLGARKNRLSTPCGASSRFIIYGTRSVDMHRIIPRILYASSS